MMANNPRLAGTRGVPASAGHVSSPTELRNDRTLDIDVLPTLALVQRLN